MRSVSPEASTAMPDPRAKREPTALYRLYSADETLLYIGISADPDRRFKQHRDAKPWWPQVAQKTIEWHPSRNRALAEEADAIKAEAPAYNIEHHPAMASYQWPPAGMPADRVDAIERETSTLPANLAEGVRRAAWEGFTRAQRPTVSLDRLIAALPAVVDEAMRKTLPDLYTPELAAEFTVAMIAELRAAHAATEALKALAADHPGIQFEEWDTATLDEPLRGRFLAHYLEHKDGTRILVVPLGQDPTVRLAAVRTLLNHQGVTA